MSKTHEFVMITDPAHGWMATNMDMLRKYGVEGLISSHSYRDGNDVYLEEDCDARILLNAIEAHGDIAAFHTDKHTNDPSWIRDLESY